MSDARLNHIGEPGYYYVCNGPRSGSRIVCLNCTAYFRTKCSRTQVPEGTHRGSMRTRYCPCCGAELLWQVTPDSEQMRLVDDCDT